MNLAATIIKGAASQFGREFGRAGANAILKGANSYTINSSPGINNPKTISYEIDGTQLNDDEQQKMVHSQQLSWHQDWFYFAWFPLFFGLPYIFLFFKNIKLRKAYTYILDNNVSYATCWFNIKVADKRTKEGFRVERELIVTQDANRTLFDEEKVVYTKLLKQATFRMWFSCIMVILSFWLITTFVINREEVNKNTKHTEQSFKSSTDIGQVLTNIPFVGKRGGVYHYNKNGNKVYKRKKK